MTSSLFFATRRPTRSTLFPYTTLFRSVAGTGQATGAADRVFGVAEVAEGRPDRKSTRLNSSHSSISYGVFCLKKRDINARRKSSKSQAASWWRSGHSIECDCYDNGAH